MTKHIPLFAASGTMHGQIVHLRCRDSYGVDPAPLQQIFDTLTEEEGEAVVCRALENIAARLDQLHAARSAAHFEMMHRCARRVAAVARQIGLVEVVQAAAHVATAAAQANGPAISATQSRLERGFDAGVARVWSFRDIG